jgi:hypothetical protein
MINIGDDPVRGDKPDESGSSLFQTQWQTYRKIVDPGAMSSRAPPQNINAIVDFSCHFAPYCGVTML